jgi:hypothetical protein
MGKLVNDMTVKALPLHEIKNEAAARLRSVIEAKLAEAMNGSSKDETRKGGKKNCDETPNRHRCESFQRHTNRLTPAPRLASGGGCHRES